MLQMNKLENLNTILSTCLRSFASGIRTFSRQKHTVQRGPTLNSRISNGKTDPHESISTGPKEFEINAHGENPAFENEYRKNLKNSKPQEAYQNSASFSEIGLRDDVIQGLEDLRISKPTVIQMKAIPEILKGKNVLCAAQTGSGKTLAYLLPILNNLKIEEDAGRMTRYQRPQVCIIAPFRELAVQILRVLKQMSHKVPIRSLGCIGGEKDRLMFKGLRERPIDVIVGTAGTIVDLLKKRKIFFTDLSYLVMDEVDTMFDASFKKITDQLFDAVHLSSPDDITRSKFAFAAATLPKVGVLNKIKNKIKSIELVTAKLHHVLPHVKYIFIKVLQPEKPAELMELLNHRISKDKKTVIFVSSASTCNWLSKYLEDHFISHKKLSGKDKPEERQKIFRSITSSNGGILLCTDIGSRGLDFPDLSCVINYDCPLNPMDFIHRAGRTGRARAEYFGIPEVYTLLSRNWEVSFCRKVQAAALRNQEIEGIHVIKRDSGLPEIRK